MSNLATAIQITAEAFKDRYDKAGKPYILHCLRVMHKLHTEDEELCSIAVMHDLLEDHPEIHEEDLYKLGFSRRVVDAVIALTHDKNLPYMDYIKKVAQNPDAVTVKRADLRDNSNITRLKGLTKADFDRMERYHMAYVYLSKV